MGCKTSFQDKPPQVQTIPNQSIGDKFRRQRQNRFKYMEKRPRMPVQVRRIDASHERVKSPAVFMLPSSPWNQANPQNQASPCKPCAAPPKNGKIHFSEFNTA